MPNANMTRSRDVSGDDHNGDHHGGTNRDRDNGGNRPLSASQFEPQTPDGQTHTYNHSTPTGVASSGGGSASRPSASAASPDHASGEQGMRNVDHASGDIANSNSNSNSNQGPRPDIDPELGATTRLSSHTSTSTNTTTTPTTTTAAHNSVPDIAMATATATVLRDGLMIDESADDYHNHHQQQHHHQLQQLQQQQQQQQRRRRSQRNKQRLRKRRAKISSSTAASASASTSRCWCRLLPHGGYTLLIATLSTMAWLASIIQDGCDYATVTGTGIINDLRVSSPKHIPPYLELGMEAYREPTRYVQDNGHDEDYQINIDGACLEYPDQFLQTRMDTMWEVSRICKFVALVLGGGGSLFVCCSTCFVFSRGTWKMLVGYELMLAAICQGVAFIWFFNEVCTDTEDAYVDSCQMSYGAKADIASCVLWFVSALLVICHYPQPKPNVKYSKADTTMDASETGDNHIDDDDDNHDDDINDHHGVDHGGDENDYDLDDDCDDDYSHEYSHSNGDDYEDYPYDCDYDEKYGHDDNINDGVQGSKKGADGYASRATKRRSTQQQRHSSPVFAISVPDHHDFGEPVHPEKEVL